MRKQKLRDIGFMSKIAASHILVDQEFEIQDIIKKLDAGESFEKLAKDHSTCPSGKSGGALGEFARGMMVKPNRVRRNEAFGKANHAGAMCAGFTN